ncbi:MAG TPA: formate dehydrogenase accessory sulfurtransferase FdhD [Roseiflexaceae bacterium]|nr:formate dehydrogenase accessory sulfurtransferase FdhD [Roseiflexaceae bacterium]
MAHARSVRATIWTYDAGQVRPRRDSLVTEEPLEIRLQAGGERRRIGLTMRTPGADFELAAGLLLAEGIVQQPHEIARISYCVDSDLSEEQRYNAVTVALRAPQFPELSALERHFSAGSACGVCGKTSVDALHMRGCQPLPHGTPVDPQVLSQLPGALRDAQQVFESTGGLHAAGLFSRNGDVLAVREDVGRHNALDKLVGWAFLNRRVPLGDTIAMLSGRASYELLQKAVVAGIPIVCSVSAPSSLAVDVARAYGVTLVGFVRGERYNVYSWPERLFIQ